jgi:PAS domain S-box-containing protein
MTVESFVPNAAPPAIGFGLVLLAVSAVWWLLVRERRARAALERALAAEADTLGMLETMLAGAPAAMAFVDRELRFVRVNKAQAAITGRPIAEHLGRTIRDMLPAMADMLEPLIRRVLATGEPLLDLAFHEQIRGRRREGIARLYPVRDAAGRVAWVGAVTIDVTARVEAERERVAIRAALAESEARFRALADSGVLGVLVADPERILEANDAFLQLIGYTREEMLRGEIRWSGVTPPEYAARDEAAIEELYRTGVCAPFQKEYLRKDGTRVPIVIGAAITQRDPLEWACFVLDVTERRRAEVALERREAELRLVMDAAPVQIGYVDRDERYRLVNHAYEAWFARPREEILGRSVSELLGDVAYADIREYIRRALRGETLHYERVIPHPVLGDRVLDVQYVPDRGPDGRVRGFVSLVTDLTERLQAEQERRNFSALVEASRDFIAIAALDGTLAYLNPAGRALLGLVPDAQLAGLSVQDCWEPDCEAAVRAAAAEAQAQGAATEFDGRLHSPGAPGEGVEVAGAAFMLHDPRSALPVAIAWTARDVRAQREAEVNLRRAQRIESVGLLAGGIAHNFNNMLMAVLGYNQYVLRGLPEESPLRRDAEEVGRAAGRAAELTRQLLAFSQRQILREEPLALNDVVADMGRMLRPLLGADVDLLLRLDPALDRVRADRSQLEQVIMNLALNARDAMPAGGRLTIETENVQLGADYAASHLGTVIPAGRYVQLSVADTGHGIDAATRARLFEPFFTTKQPGRGTGLGLAMVYGTVKQSGGFIWVYSETGLGTTFKIYLPASPDRVPVATVREALPPVGGTETVLVVEDEDTVRTLAVRTLELHGYTVLAARDAAGAVRLLQASRAPLHLLITDMVLPGASGREVAARVLERYPGIPIVYMSGYTPDDLVTRGLRDAGSPCIQKPFLPDALVRLVRSALGPHAVAGPL